MVAMASKVLLCVMLCCVAVPALAREAAMLSPGGSCAVAQDENAEAEAARGTTDKRTGQPPAATRTTQQPRRAGEGESAVRPPRWHSFLPGMFR
jgi:hypothetical protein